MMIIRLQGKCIYTRKSTTFEIIYQAHKKFDQGRRRSLIPSEERGERTKYLRDCFRALSISHVRENQGNRIKNCSHLRGQNQGSKESKLQAKLSRKKGMTKRRKRRLDLPLFSHTCQLGFLQQRLSTAVLKQLVEILRRSQNLKYWNKFDQC